MKNFLLILTMLFGILLFSPEEETKSDTMFMPDQEVVMKEKDAADMQYYLTVLSSDLKGSNFLTPRRTIQSTNYTLNLRIQKSAEKVLQVLRLKDINAQGKVFENLSICQTINVSTLLCRMGYHVLALRKLII